MKLPVLILLAAFVSIAVFGFIGLSHGSIFSTCAMAVMSGSPSCPVEPTAESSLLHAQIFQSFSEGTLLTLLLLVTIILACLALLTVLELPASKASYFATDFQLLSSKTHFKTKLLRWFQLLVKQGALSA
ncbi:MAG: hypothetical protein A3H72_00775 [Candidatus Doudnabacteria bacterium RIFCSPLOWO2_02_FULL_48_8]|uniref:Uncharacterized protein n=1 Tax=Candidatus Doudnabacteria bacterium RIFCSPHIGHO2_01_FULL_46_24 TaxID=1817825 RepID=A0A1F5NUQ8_9BACT|nr:MAG: hypothetical protein A2720_02510 [Candidatus Doudnabacteria bacterium RIFCSPHIGHO2_01_FULL_46_24]OGE94222.1 MAG: hypothetical protein A3E98_00155 [Candidatus Doudnabacteria bacterium RIFCSPHIGHO2_12_FULL_48_11]OGE95440.1 MAG: hypothetical protein A3H72_00775 [Candidatus Doudnabacteria bacterium RIFCSPLOWO2_02_FULL_48_8]